MAILVRDKSIIKNALDEHVLLPFFQNHRYSTYESGMIKLDGLNTVSIDLSKLKGSHLFGHIKTDELYNELDINHYKFIGNNPTEPLYTNVQVSLGAEFDKNITFEYISPVKDSFIRLDTSYYKGIKEIKGNIELDFIGITSTLEYAIEGFWRVDKKYLTQVHDIHQHTGMVPTVQRNYTAFDEEVLENRLEAKVARRTGKQNLYSTLMDDVMYALIYNDGVCFIIKNPKQLVHKYGYGGSGKGIIELKVNNFKRTRSGFLVYFMKLK